MQRAFVPRHEYRVLQAAVGDASEEDARHLQGLVLTSRVSGLQSLTLGSGCTRFRHALLQVLLYGGTSTAVAKCLQS